MTREKQSIYALFAISVIASGVGALSQTATNSMLMGIQASFGVFENLGQWLTTSYMLVIGITVPVVSFLAKRFSIRGLICASICIFIAGSLACEFAISFWMLLAGRIIQAIATGITLPLLQTIAVIYFPPDRVGTAMGISGIALGFAPNIGPLVGGAMLESWGWPSFFLMCAIIMAVLLVLLLFLTNAQQKPGGQAHMDLLSLVLSTLGFGGILIALTNATAMELIHALVLGPLAVGAVCLVWFVIRQTRIDNPLIDMGIFKAQNFGASFTAQNLLFASFMGITLIIPLFVQNILGASAFEAGLIFVPATIIALFVNPISGMLADRFGFRVVLITSGTFLAVGAASMIFVSETTTIQELMIMQTIRSIGVSGSISPAIAWGMMRLPKELSVDGSAFMTTVRQACASIGTAIMMMVIYLMLPLSGSGEAGSSCVGYQAAFGVSAVLSAAFLVLCIWKVRNRND